MIDRLFFVVLVLNATGLFRFVAPQFGVSIGLVSLVLLGLHGVYLLSRRRYLVLLLRGGDAKSWLFLLCFWPILTGIYAPTLEFRPIALQLYYVSLFLGTCVYTIANGLTSVYRVILVSLAISIFGLTLSMIIPEYFEEVAFLADARSSYMGRSFGFFMQPNALATGLSFLFIGFFSLWNSRSVFHEAFALLAFFLAMLLTGSRTGMLMAAMVVALHFTYQWMAGLRWEGAILRFNKKLLILTICTILGVAVARIYMSSMEWQMQRSELDLIQRVSSLFDLRLSKDNRLENDISLRERLIAQKVYRKFIDKKPFLGHGLGAEDYYLKRGAIYLSSHSTAHRLAMEYGVFYPILFVVLMLRLAMNRHRAEVESVFGTNSVWQFTLLICVFFVLTGEQLNSRTFYVVFGMFYSAVHQRESLFCQDSASKGIDACMSRKSIRSLPFSCNKSDKFCHSFSNDLERAG